MESIDVKGKTYKLPIFLPDATRATVKALDPKDLSLCGIEGAVVNTYHLQETPGVEVLEKIGGIKKLMNFSGLIASDSGGWQIFSLIHRNNGYGKITDAGVVFGKGKKIFTPEMSIQTQFAINSDIIVCLDDFTHPNADKTAIKASIERTVAWAKRSKQEFEIQANLRGLSKHTKPKLMAVIQGGFDRELRKECASKLMEIGFDGYGYGGYAIKEGGLDLELSEYVANLIPEKAFKFALGNGTPWDIASLRSFGWDIFDCTLPTRDARHQRLYCIAKSLTKNNAVEKNTYTYVNIKQSRYKTDLSPISDTCSCHTCTNYTKAYLHQLFRIGDFTALRLASIHNLATYASVITTLRN